MRSNASRAAMVAVIAVPLSLLAPATAQANPLPSGEGHAQTAATAPTDPTAGKEWKSPWARKDPIIITDNPYHDWECFRYGENCPK